MNFTLLLNFIIQYLQHEIKNIPLDFYRVFAEKGTKVISVLEVKSPYTKVDKVSVSVERNGHGTGWVRRDGEKYAVEAQVSWRSEEKENNHEDGRVSLTLLPRI